jgi:hypothetical protein
MALRSRYRTAETPTPNIQLEIKIDGAEPETVTSISADLPLEAEPVEAAAEPPPVDEATQALMRQLEQLRQSEELQRQYAMHQHAVQASQRTQPQTRVQFLQSQGLTKAEAEFFDRREDIDGEPATG